MNRAGPAATVSCALVAFASFFAGAGLAWHHPLWPLTALASFCLVCIAAAWRRGWWLMAVPACLPWLNFSPWSGWLVFEEFDLLLLGVFAGSYARQAWLARLPPSADVPVLPGRDVSDPVAARNASDLVAAGLLVSLAGIGLLALARGLIDAGSLSLGWFQGYADPLNSVRVSKSLLFALLTIPLLRDEMASSKERAALRVGLGMVLGLACVVMVALWERLAYPGLFDFATVYRVSALFWEMHMGGGAIDAYLVMATPFVVWALATARRRAAWLASALLAVLTLYACLMTFSRGVYLTAPLPLLGLGAAALLRRIRAARHASSRDGRAARRTSGRRLTVLASLGLTVAVLLGLVLDASSFMTNRMANTERVLEARKAHWRHAVGLLSTPTVWWLGIGAGRFPARFDQAVPDAKFSGRAQVHAESMPAASDRRFVRIEGAAIGSNTGGLFALTQRVAPQPDVLYSASMAIRAERNTHVVVQLCERHLLYEWDCQGANLRIQGRPGEWQPYAFELGGTPFTPSDWFAPRLGMLSIHIVSEGATVDFSRVGLMAPGSRELLANGDFSRGLAHWFPAAQYYYLPWHTDSLYLELLVERGLLGLAAFVALMAFVMVRIMMGLSRDPGIPGQAREDDRVSITIYLAASLGGALLVGVVSSILDVPRVAFLLHFLSFFALQLTLSRSRAVPPLGGRGESMHPRQRAPTKRAASPQPLV